MSGYRGDRDASGEIGSKGFSADASDVAMDGKRIRLLEMT
jgi:hypothetical protein